jgi:hypothetical protein
MQLNVQCSIEACSTYTDKKHGNTMDRANSTVIRQNAYICYSHAFDKEL